MAGVGAEALQPTSPGYLAAMRTEGRGATSGRAQWPCALPAARWPLPLPLPAASCTPCAACCQLPAARWCCVPRAACCTAI